MQADSFDVLRKMLKDRSGLVVVPEKAYLLESRLMPVARKWNVKGLDDLVALLRSSDDQRLATNITEAMTTNETLFFRDAQPFEQFRSAVLPALLARRAAEKQIRIWCAGASTGQEPYSLAMILREERALLEGWRVDILGTDLSSDLLAKARAGLYTQFEIQRGLPIRYLVKNFTQIGDKWELSQEIRQMVEFQQFNLLEDPSALGRFDVVLCRNVLIYFDRSDRAVVLAKIASQMPGDGVLSLGAAATVYGITDRFRPVDGHRGFFQPQSAGADPGRQTAAAG